MRLSDTDWLAIHVNPIEAVFMFKDRIANDIDTSVKEHIIKNTAEAKVTIHGNVNDEDFWYLHEYDIRGVGLPVSHYLKVAEVRLVDGTDYVEEGKIKVEIEKSQLTKCPRCRLFVKDIGPVKEWNEVCRRCAEVLESMYTEYKQLNKSKELWEAREKFNENISD